jgi:hypothetical protein
MNLKQNVHGSGEAGGMERQRRAIVNSRQRTDSEILNFRFVKETKDLNIEC